VPGTFDLLFRFLVLAAVSLSTWTLYRLLVVWRALRACLHGVESMPIGAAFLRLPSAIAGLTRFTPFNAPTAAAVDLTIDRAAAERWTELLAIESRPDYALDLPLVPVPRPAPAYAIRAAHGTLDPDVATPLVRLHKSLCAGAAVGAVPLDPEAREAKREATPEATQEATQEANPRPTAPRRTWPLVAQELVALYVVDYVEWVVRHLRHLALSLVVALALTTVLLSSYPFEPASLVKVFFFAVMAASVASIASLLFQMSRNVTMSRITHTTPGQVNWDTQLVFNLVLVSAVPILTLLTAQFPQIRGFLFSWVTPALTSISKG
jgi:hypothetical protein